MKSSLTAVFLAAASTLSLQAEWIDSPMLRIGSELDVFATAQARLEFDDNLFYRQNSGAGLPNAGVFYDVVPGLEFQYGKDLPLTGTFNLSRRYRTFFNSALRSLNDEQDFGQFALTYDGGGPLKLDATALYSETARNTDELAAFATLGGSLVRQTNYAQSIKATYQFTERTQGSIAVRHTSNRYDPVDITVFTPLPVIQPNTTGLQEYDGWVIPLSARYKFSEKISAALDLEFGETDLSPARGNLGAGVVVDTLDRKYYGFTVNYAASDKLDYEFKVGFLDSSYQTKAFSKQTPSYSLRASHMLTEKIDHSLTFAQDASASPTGGLSDAFRIAYDLNFNNSEAVRSFFRLNYSNSSVNSFNPLTSAVSESDIQVLGASLGGSYTPDTHWVYSFNYSYSHSLSNNFDVNRISAEASFRW